MKNDGISFPGANLLNKWMDQVLTKLTEKHCCDETFS